MLLNLAGTPYDGTGDFLDKYKEDGILWYLESFDLGCEQMMEGLWKMRQMGWFDHVTGFVLDVLCSIGTRDLTELCFRPMSR